MAEGKSIMPAFRPEEKGLGRSLATSKPASMQCLWTRGQGTVGDVYKELVVQRELAYTTVKTIIDHLAEKGYWQCDSRQRAYVYAPTQSREAFMGQVSDAMLSGLFQDFGATIAAACAGRDDASV